MLLVINYCIIKKCKRVNWFILKVSEGMAKERILMGSAKRLLFRTQRMTGLNSSSCAEKRSHGLTPTSFKWLQYTTSEMGRHWTLKQVAIFAHLKYTRLGNWDLGLEQDWVAFAAVGLRKGAGPGSLARGNWTPYWGAVYRWLSPLYFMGGKAIFVLSHRRLMRC